MTTLPEADPNVKCHCGEPARIFTANNGFCLKHVPLNVLKEIDNGVRFLRRWSESNKNNNNTVSDITLDEFKEEFQQARERVNWCARQIRKGSIIIYHSKKIELNEIPAIRKFLNSQQKHFNKALTSITRIKCYKEVKKITENLMLYEPETDSVKIANDSIQNMTTWMGRSELKVKTKNLRPPPLVNVAGADDELERTLNEMKAKKTT